MVTEDGDKRHPCKAVNTIVMTSGMEFEAMPRRGKSTALHREKAAGILDGVGHKAEKQPTSIVHEIAFVSTQQTCSRKPGCTFSCRGKASSE